MKYTRFHTTALCSPTRQALLTGRNHHSVGMGGITEIATSAPGYTSMRPNTKAPLAETLKLNGYSTAQFGKMPRGPGLGDEPDGPVRSLAGRRRRLRVLLRLHRRRGQPVGSRAVRGLHPDRTAEDAGGGLPPHRGPGRSCDLLGPPAEGADAGQAVLHVLRARRDTRAAPRAEGVDRQVQGQVRPRLGQAARDHVREAEGPWASSARMPS